jgi:outer membrane lipoprotein-sorting protein
MKLKLFFIYCILLCSSFLFAKEQNIKMYYNEILVGEMSINEFDTLLKSAQLYEKEIKAEKNNKVKIHLKESPYNITVGSKFSTEIYITWEDEKNNVFKQINISHKITLKKEPLSEFRIIYRDISEISTPVLLFIVFVLAIL